MRTTTTFELCRLLAPWLLLGGCATEEPPAQEQPAPPAAEQTACTEVSVHCGSVPGVRFDGQGLLWAVFEQGGHVYVTTSSDLGEGYSPPVEVNPEPEEIETSGENRPKIALAGDARTGGETVYVSWTRKLEGRFTGEIRFSRSLDGGRSFEPPRTVNDDGLVLGHRFDSLHVDAAGDVYLAWIDKRDLEAAKARGEEYVGAAVYSTVSTDRGASFAPNRRVADHACECCRIAMTERAQDDGVAIFWRHVFDADVRDHAFATLSAGGVSSPLQRATRDGWHIDGCPHHGPAIAAAGQASYHLAWFTAPEAQPVVYYGRFDAATGEVHHQVSMTGSGAHPHLLAAGGRLLVTWKQPDPERTSVFVRSSADGGETWGEPRLVADTTSSRSDHPFLVQRGEDAFLSWHTASEGLRILRLFI